MEAMETEERRLDMPLTKAGNSLAVIVPARVCRALNLTHGNFVTILLKRKA